MELLAVFLLAGIGYWILRGIKAVLLISLGIVIAIFKLLTYRKPKPYYTYTRS